MPIPFTRSDGGLALSVGFLARPEVMIAAIEKKREWGEEISCAHRVEVYSIVNYEVMNVVIV